MLYVFLTTFQIFFAILRELSISIRGDFTVSLPRKLSNEVSCEFQTPLISRSQSEGHWWSPYYGIFWLESRAACKQLSYLWNESNRVIRISFQFRHYSCLINRLVNQKWFPVLKSRFILYWFGFLTSTHGRTIFILICLQNKIFQCLQNVYRSLDPQSFLFKIESVIRLDNFNIWNRYIVLSCFQ